MRSQIMGNTQLCIPRYLTIESGRIYCTLAVRVGLLGCLNQCVSKYDLCSRVIEKQRCKIVKL